MKSTFVTLAHPAVPAEQIGNVPHGIFGHLGSPIAYVLVLAYVGVTPWSAIWVFLAVSVVFMTFTLTAEKLQPAIALPAATWREVWDGMFMVFVKGVGIGGGFVTAGWWALSHVPLWGPLSNSWWLVAAATAGTDLAYYTIHRLMSHSRHNTSILKYYRRKHWAHHAVTELDFLRGNQSSLVDTAISQFQPSLIVIAWLLGMDLGATLAAYALILALQATDHTNITFNIGWLRYIFMDNHAHKLHHCKKGNLVNFAAAFSIWDRLLGTFYEDWSISANHLHHHGVALPIKAVDSPANG